MCKDCGCGQEGSKRATLSVRGIGGGTCKPLVESALLQLPGVLAVDVTEDLVTVDYKDENGLIDMMKNAITAAGFDVDPDVKVESVMGHHHDGLMGTIKKMFDNK